MKRLLPFSLLIPLILLALTGLSGPALGEDSFPAEEVLPGVEEALLLTVHAGRLVLEDQAAQPKVIDRISNPSAGAGFSFSPEDDLLEIWLPSVRDQDAAIFLYQGQVWMLDCGDSRASKESVPLLKYLGVERIDRLINTHPHHDHLNGLYAVDASFPVGELMICFPEDSTTHMTAAMEYCKGNGIPVTHFGDESILSMGDGLVTFLAWQKSAETESLNDRSAQFMVSYGSCDMLFMADMELRGQRQLLDALGPEPLKADILRYPHHGKKAMLDEVFYSIDPALVIVTNSPRVVEIAESTKYLDYKHVPVAYTNRTDYVIRLVTDGRHWLCESVPFHPADYLPQPSPSAGPSESPAPEASGTPAPEASGTPAPKTSPVP